MPKEDENTDLNEEGGDDSTGTGQTENDDAGSDGDNGGEGTNEETVTLPKAELDQLKSDRENYRQATLKKKGEGSSGDDSSGEGDEGEEETNTETSASVDVKAQVDEGINAFKNESYDSNDQRARDKFRQDHPEYENDSVWQNFLANDLMSKRGRATVDDIMDDLEDSHLLHLKRTGKLNDYLEAQRKQGQGEGRTEAQAGDTASAGGAGDQRTTGESSGEALTPQGERMSRLMHVDPKEAAKIDPQKDNTIRIE